MCPQFPRILVVLLVWLLPLLSVQSAPIPITEIKELDKQFKKLSSEVYKKSLSKLDKVKIKDIQSLHKLTTKLVAENQHFRAIGYIVKYQNLIKENIDDDSIFFFINLLIKHNEWKTVSKLFKYIIAEGDKSLVSNVKFIFVKYYNDRNEWDKTLNLLTDIFDDLTVEDGDYALILKGITLQRLRKHREALQYYRKIPVTSKLYNYAQLNIAVVFIRQGWWSDAHITMNNLLKERPDLYEQQPEFVNRLYLVLGYSFLQQEYFRESREAFRNIKLNSKFADRALLGISLASANQGDNIGSLNVLNILQDKKSQVLAVEESYLLLPYVYEKIGQHKTSSASYSIALNYYKKRVHEIDSIINALKKRAITDIQYKDNIIIIRNNSVDLTDHYPVSFLTSLNEIKLFKSNISDAKLSKKVISLHVKYYNMLMRIIIERLTERKIYLQDYLNQSRYGIARLYDNSKSSQETHE